MIRLFSGYDTGEAIGFHVFVHSVLKHATAPVSITPLSSMGMPTGSNSFTMSRFLVPWLCGYKGHAIFADSCDMLMLGDIAELDRLFDPRFAVQVVQHPDYETRHPRKYIGTAMEGPNLNYARKNWASLMLINCEHPVWFGFRPESMPATPLPFLQFEHHRAGEIGNLPACWNVLADEGQNTDGAKLLHWTAGIPGFDHYRDAPASEHWHTARAEMETTA